eukprot:TRINITY_DN185_c0_g1_i2.p1 TRINITY_DN185_c0_g1~~TRINITY_DN185_c0_g1_i2.p1  ORF type:complete len:172 (-),score=25.63 TRINITY_DN185_c0_g1_i2:583-1098(-)
MDWELLGLVIAILIPVGQGFLSTFLSDGGGGDSEWYKSLKKPWYTPPGWVFPVMWTSLYLMMGIASWLVWKQGGFKHQSLPLSVYTFQLILNFLWTPIFFGMHQIGLALVEIVVMWFAILATIYTFYPVSHTAAYLLVPYIIWVSLATSLNLSIARNNRRRHGDSKPAKEE